MRQHSLLEWTGVLLQQLASYTISLLERATITPERACVAAEGSHKRQERARSAPARGRQRPPGAKRDPCGPGGAHHCRLRSPQRTDTLASLSVA